MFKQFDAVQHFSRLHVVGVRHDPREGSRPRRDVPKNSSWLRIAFATSVNTDLNAVVFL
jgi:hypothetical protein